MKCKYEITYWDYYSNQEITEKQTNSLIEALWTLYELERRYNFISVKFTKNKLDK